MGDGWASPAVVVAGVVAAISAVTGVIAWLTYRATAPRDVPIAKLNIRHERASRPYVTCDLTLENPSGSTWVEIVFEILRPRGLIYADSADVRSYQSRTDNDVKQFDTAFERVASQTPIVISGTLHAWGSTSRVVFGRGGNPTDELKRSILIQSSSLGGRHDLSIKVSLASNDARPRRHVIQIRRQIPERRDAGSG